MHRKITIARAFCSAVLLTLAGFASPVGAVPLAITSSPQETSGGFIHNVFHTAHRGDGTGGTILAWYDLKLDGILDYYDPSTGAFQADFRVFSDSGLSTQIGTVIGRSPATGIPGSGLTAAVLNGTSGVVAGKITWSFSLDAGNALANHLGGTDPTVTMTFLSNDFATSSAGRIANSYLADGGTFFLTLWGADGYAGSGSTYPNATLGTDLVVDPTVPVPEPATILLFGFGLLGLAFASRRRRLEPARQSV